MTVSLWIRETFRGKRCFVKPNKKKLYPDGTVFCLRYTADGKRRWETLRVNTLTAALIERATKEAELLSEAPKAASPVAKRTKVEDFIATYLGTVAATRAHKTWLAYNLILGFLQVGAEDRYGVALSTLGSAFRVLFGWDVPSKRT
jgi:hypothetical protein